MAGDGVDGVHDRGDGHVDDAHVGDRARLELAQAIRAGRQPHRGGSSQGCGLQESARQILVLIPLGSRQVEEEGDVLE